MDIEIVSCKKCGDGLTVREWSSRGDVQITVSPCGCSSEKTSDTLIGAAKSGITLAIEDLEMGRSREALLRLRNILEFLDREASGWISVKDRLPKDRQEVLTYWAEENRVDAQKFYLDYAGYGPWWMFGWQNHLLANARITHWMPKPEGPPEETGKGRYDDVLEALTEKLRQCEEY